jgi:hypothetical protein
MRSLRLVFGMLVPAMAAAQTLTLQLQAPYSAVYSFTASIESLQDMGGMGAMTVNTSVESQLRLESAQNARDTLTLTWHMEGTKVSGIPTGGMDTTMKLAPIAARLTLLRNGTVVHQQWLDTSGLAGGEMFGQGGMLSGLVQGTSHPWKIEFPAKPITVGESWEIAHTDTLDRSGKGSSVRSAKATYRLEALVDTLGTRCARIRSTTQFEFSVQQQTQYGTVSVQGTGTARGVAYVEVKSGFLVARQEDSESQMEMAFSGQIEMVGSMQQSLQYRLVRLQ